MYRNATFCSSYSCLFLFFGGKKSETTDQDEQEGTRKNKKDSSRNLASTCLEFQNDLAEALV